MRIDISPADINAIPPVINPPVTIPLTSAFFWAVIRSGSTPFIPKPINFVIAPILSQTFAVSIMGYPETKQRIATTFCFSMLCLGFTLGYSFLMDKDSHYSTGLVNAFCIPMDVSFAGVVFFIKKFRPPWDYH
jgi:hypothetical protein